MTAVAIEKAVFGQADLTNCDREPIHIPASIQPAGCMMGFTGPEHRLSRFSENTSIFMKRSPVQIGMKLTECVGEEAATTILSLAENGDTTYPIIEFNVSCSEQQERDIAVHRAGDLIIVEFELPTPPQLHASLAVRQRRLIEHIRNPSDILSLLQRSAASIRQMFGYDRVMVYRFAPDWSGHVIVEERRENLESFLGQRFPSSDIPAQARELYKRSLIRVVSDASFRPVPLIESPGDAPLDMSFMHLRAVSPVHCEYLINMGVHASMSVSLIVDGKLWGLIACHHYTPHTLLMAERIAAKLIGEFIGLQVVSLHRSRRLDLSQSTHKFLHQFLHDSCAITDLLQCAPEYLSRLDEFIACDGSGVLTEQGWISHGLAMTEAEVRTLVAKAGTSSGNQVWLSDCLNKSCGFSPSSAICGAMIIPFSPEQDDCLVLFRQEIIRTVVWGGDPKKTYATGPLGLRLTPRRSFEIWTEEVTGHSTDWSNEDLEIAALFRTSLMEVAARSAWLKLQETILADNNRRMLTEELNHRVKNVLAMVGSVVARLPPENDSATRYRDTIQERFKALGRAHDLAMSSTEDGSLRNLLAAEIAPYSSGEGKIILNGPDLFVTDRALSLLALLFHELTTNAVKYGALSTPAGQLTITWTSDLSTDFCHIRWQERNGPVVRAPTRSGFGSLLIERAITHDLGGSATTSFDPEGITVDIRLPTSALVSTTHQNTENSVIQTETVPDQKTDQSNLLQGKTVLILEDEFLIALDMQDTLISDFGANAIIASDVPSALDIVHTSPIDIAFLDMNLNDVSSAPVATLLMEKSIPFMYATGYTKENLPSAPLPTVPVLEKPYIASEAASALSTVLANHGCSE